MAKNDKEGAPAQPQPENLKVPRVKWDTTGIKCSYANFANVDSTREEIVLNFGVNQSWDRPDSGEYEIELSHRIAMSPFAAKRLTSLLNNLITESEKRHGELK